MIYGKFLTMNVGNFDYKATDYTYSLADRNLATLIARKVSEINADIIVAQEIWTYADIVFQETYDFIGQNDTIAVKKNFGKLRNESFRSNSIQFKKSLKSEPYPNLKNKQELALHMDYLEMEPYNGLKNSKYGIPTSFDVTSIIVDIYPDMLPVLIVNVHVHSSPSNDKKRAYEIREWIAKDCWNRAVKECDGRILIGGDFNHDELRLKRFKSTSAMKKLLDLPGMNDAAIKNQEPTTNYPILNFRLDHIMGTANFSNYTVQQSLRDEDYRLLRRKKRLLHWMYLDHKNISANFSFP